MLPARPVTRFPNTYAQVAQPSDVDATAADLTEARALLGYEPQVDLAEGLRRQWEWLATSEHRSHPTTIEAVATPFGQASRPPPQGMPHGTVLLIAEGHQRMSDGDQLTLSGTGTPTAPMHRCGAPRPPGHAHQSVPGSR